MKNINVNDLNAFFHAALSRETDMVDEEIVIANFSSQPDHIALPDGFLEMEPMNHLHANLPGSKSISFKVLVDNRETAEVTMKGTVEWHGYVVCLANSLERNSIIAHGDIRLEKHDISRGRDTLIRNPEEVVGKRLKATLRKGDCLYEEILDAPMLIKRGDAVKILARSDNLSISLSGEARSSGAAGETIRVKNIMSRKLLEARVIDRGLVEIDFN